METFGERLKRLRTERNLSPGALSMKVGVTEGAIRQMESGQTKSASFQVGVLLADELGVTPRYLALGDTTQPAMPLEGAAVSRLEQLIAENREMVARVSERQQASIAEVSRRLQELESASTGRRRQTRTSE